MPIFLIPIVVLIVAISSFSIYNYTTKNSGSLPTPSTIPVRVSPSPTTIFPISKITNFVTKTPTPIPENTATQFNPISTPAPTSSPQNNTRLDSIDPSSANFQQEISLKGSNFGTSPGMVAFYNVLGQASAGAPVIIWGDTEIKVTVPFVSGGQDYNIEVQKSDGKRSNRVIFMVILGQPRIDNISPSGAKPGNHITLQGLALGTSPGTVKFIINYPNVEGTGGIISWSDTSIQTTIPSILQLAKEYAIQVVTSDGRETSVKYYTLGTN